MNDEEYQSNNLEDTMEDEIQKKRQEQQINEQQESQLKKQIKGQAEEYAKEASKKVVNKAKNALFKSVTTSVGTVVFGVIIVLILLIGIISFILTMPGITQEKIFQTVSGVIDGIASFLRGADEDNIIYAEQIKTGTINALNDLNDNGLDPVGLGFVHLAQKDETGKIINYQEDPGTFITALKINGDHLIVDDLPNVSALASYIWSNEKTYLPETYYMKVNKDDSIDLIDFATSFWGSRLLKTYQSYLKQTDGMLVLHEEETLKEAIINSATGALVPNYKEVDITVDRNTHVLNGASTNFEGLKLYNQSYSIDLEDWIGRYGKTYELLVALHLATMTSGITEELITNEDIQTKVEITFEDATYDVDFKVELENEDGTKTKLPINFGYDEDDIYEEVMQNIDKDTYKYEKNNSGLEISDITICALKDLIFKLENEITTTSTESQNEVIEYKKYMEQAIDTLLYSTTKYYVKYDIHDYDMYNKYLGAFIGKSATNQTTGNGLLTSGNTVEFNSASTNRSEYNFKANKNSSSLTNGTVQYSITDLESNSNDKSIQKIHNLYYYVNHRGELKPEVVDGITAMLIQLDNYLYSSGIQKNFHENVNINLQNLSFVDANGNTRKIYVSNVDKYNVYSENSSTLGASFYFTEKWLEMRDNKDYDELKSLCDEIKESKETLGNKEQLVNTIIEDLWYDVVDKEKTTKPITKQDINNIYDIISNYTKGVRDIKMSYPRILNVTNHWFKDLDFEYDGMYTNSNNAVEALAYDKDGITITALMTSSQHKTQSADAQPYVIKGDIVTLDGELVDENEYTPDSKFGKGYEATKKIFTAGHYYVYDGTVSTSTGIYYNELLENIIPGNMVEVRVKDDGNIMFIRGVDYNTNIGSKTFIDKSNNIIANVLDDQTLTWEIDGDVISLEKTNCKVIKFGENERIEQSSGEVENNSEEKTETTGKVYKYYVYIPETESLKYISAAESVSGAKESAEKINDLLLAIGVTHLRQPVSFDNTTGTGDVATLTAFSILEGMKTTSSQAVYRDLKEFLIELGYYSQAEFEYLGTNVLTWFIPDYIPSNPDNWKENTFEDAGLYGGVLYPAKVEDGNKDENTDNIGNTGNTENTENSEQNANGTTSENENQDGTENNKENKKTGFVEGLEVVAPGNCRIINYEINNENPEESFIVLEFDGVSQPEIGMLDKYTMTIVGINIANNILIKNDNGTEEFEISIEEAKYEEGKKEYIIKMNTVIGYTGTEKIQVILKNANGAFISNIEDYMAPKLKVENSYGEAVEIACEMLAPFEGESDANPNDGDYYTVVHPSNDIDTIGRGITGHTAKVWKDLGYGEYIIPNNRHIEGVTNPTETIKDIPIPKSVVEEVKKEVVRRMIEDVLDPELQKHGVEWANYQKAAWVCLYYNGYGNRAKGKRPIDIVEHYSNGNISQIKELWLDCYNRGVFEEGHKKRRATEYKMFATGQWENSEKWMLDCKEEYYGYR